MSRQQKIITDYKDMRIWAQESGAKKCLLVCGNSVSHLRAFNKYLQEIEHDVDVVHFSDFRPNPLYESVVEGVKVFRESACDSIVAVGGGSAIDVAKCIKLYSNMQGDGMNGDFLVQQPISNDIPFLAMPTTAGTGSEATRYAVIYYRDMKQSITSELLLPDTILMDSNVLKTLPLYQRKATMLDAFAHAIESFWSVNSTVVSKKYSEEAIQLILRHMKGYLMDNDEGNRGMLMAAHIAGKAINITQTTAGHAMCYKVTSMFSVAHGHAAAMCNRVLFPWMLRHMDRCIDPRGMDYLALTFEEIADAMGCRSAMEAADRTRKMFDDMELEVPTATKEQIEQLKVSVNPVRLKNHPIRLDEEIIGQLYQEILSR